MKNLLKNGLFGLLFLLAACASDQDGDRVHDKRDKCPDTPKGTKVDITGCPVVVIETKEKIGSINFYLENSASMAGYLNGNTEFKNVVTDLVVLLDGVETNKELKINTISNQISPYKGSSNQFRNELATVPMAREKSSEMHNIFRKILEKAGPSDINVLVSDLILSFPDEAIRNNRQVNVENAESTLKSDIKSTFQKFRKQGIATSVYAFTSEFNGPYYTYENQKINYNNAQRPFYVWITGKKEFLNTFNSILQNQSSFKPAEQLHFGFDSEPAGNHLLLYTLLNDRNYKVKPPYKNLSEVDISAKKPLTFVVGMNMSELPAFAREKKYLQENIKLQSDGKIKASLLNVQDYSEIEANIKNAKEKERAVTAGLTHYFTIQVAEMISDPAELRLILPKEIGNWYKNWSTMNDRQPNQKGAPKTFAFEHLINGVKEAYQTSGGANLINTSITLSK